MSIIASDEEIEQEFAKLIQPPELKLPRFEGQDVEEIGASFKGASNLELDSIHTVDEIVRLVVEARVVGISHNVNETTGKLRRSHALKIVDVVPYEYTDER